MVSGNFGGDTGFFGNDDCSGVDGDSGFEAGTDERGLRFKQRHRLTLHV